ncbi:MAG: ROK family protein, partial [Phycisphaerales bacterium]|nr:ROK family protein [Phycisphaerales bacterium]
MRLGIDLGGTKIAAGVLDGEDNEVLRHRVATPQGDYEATIESVAGLVDLCEEEIGQKCTVGIGYPGSVSPARGVHRNANSTCLNGRDLIGDLQKRLDRAVRGANDANCLALSESFDGAGRGARVVFAVIVGTGTGGGIVVDQKIVVGRNAIGGEWGHCPMPQTDRAERRARPCYCGQFGCIEQFLSGPALEAEYFRHESEHRSLEEITGRAATRCDQSARAVIELLCERLADALAVVVNTLDPDAIVLGGGVSNIKAIYERVPELIRQRIFSDQFETPLLPAKFGDASGVRGAARLW